MFNCGGVLAVPEIDVAERIVCGGEAALILRCGEKFERGFEQGEREVCAVATKVRRALGECARRFVRRVCRRLGRSRVFRARRRRCRDSVGEWRKRDDTRKTYREQRKIKAFGHLWPPIIGRKIEGGVFRASAR